MTADRREASKHPAPDHAGRALEHLWAVVPAGGAGTRLWPLSRRHEPKFLRDLTGEGRSLLQSTYDRLVPLVEGRFLVVTGTAHRDAVAAQLEELAATAVLAEPSPRDSMAAIGLAAAVLEQRDPEAVLGSFAADHVVRDVTAFHDAVTTAVEVARQGWLVTIGVEPTFASTAFGYLRVGSPLPAHPAAYAVEAFVEKPSAAVATDYLADGRYRWNAGMFVVRPRVLLDLLGREHPAFARDLRDLAAGGVEGLEERIADRWSALPRIALDHAVAEPAAEAGKVATVPADLGWDDVGDFASLVGLLAAGPQLDDTGGGADPGADPGDAGADDPGPQVLGPADLVAAIDSSGLVVPGSGRLVAVVGLDDVVVVDTPDAVLVTTRDRAQEVKRVVGLLQDTGRDHLT